MRREFSQIMLGIIAAGLLAGCAGVPESKKDGREQQLRSSSLSVAVRRGDLAGVMYHVKHNANVMETDGRGRTMLHLAVMSGNLEIVQYLVEHGAKVNAQDAKGKTPLHIADALKRNNISEYLIRQGADRKIQDRDGRAPGELKSNTIENQIPRHSMQSGQSGDPFRSRSKASRKKRKKSRHVTIIRTEADR